MSAQVFKCVCSLRPHVNLCVLGVSDLQTLQCCTSVVLMVWQPVVVCYITPLKRIFYKPSGLLVLREMQAVAVFSAFSAFPLHMLGFSLYAIN